MKWFRRLLPFRNATEYLSAPLSDLPPELAGFLIEQKFKPRFITASIFELAHQGAIRIEPPHASNSTNFIFHNLLSDTAFDEMRFRGFIESAKVHEAFRELLVLQDDGTLNRLEAVGDELAKKLHVLLKLWNTISDPEEDVRANVFEGEFLQKLEDARTCRWDTQHWSSADDPKESLRKIYWLYHYDHNTSLPYEKLLLRSIFSSRATQKLSTLEKQFSTYQLKRIKRLFYARAREKGFFPPKFNEETRFMWGCTGFILASALLYISLILIAKYLAAILGFLLAAGAVGFVIIKKKSFRTAKGNEEAAKLQAFKRYLKDKNILPEQSRRQEEFEAFLPYAIAFGVEWYFIRKFVSADIPAPTWWISKEKELSLKNISADLEELIRSITESVSMACVDSERSGGNGGGYTSSHAGATSGFGGGSSGGGGSGCCGGGGG